MIFKLVVVTWMDAWGQDSQSDVEHLSHAPVETNTVGWLIQEDESGVSIAMDTYPDSQEEVRNTAFIPRGMVRKITYLHGYKSDDEER